MTKKFIVTPIFTLAILLASNAKTKDQLITEIMDKTKTEKPTDINKQKEPQKILSQNFDDITFEWSGVIGEVLQKCGDKHFFIKDPKKAIIKACKSYLKSLDPHSDFLDPKTYKSIVEATSGQFFGIGIVIDDTRNQEDKFLTVISTIPNGPAEKAGVMAFDKIIEIDDEKLDGISIEAATAKLKGPKGTTVKIRVLRENKKEPLVFEVTRDVVKAKTSFAFYLKDYDVYYVCLTQFSATALKQIKDILEKSVKKPYKGLIIDLRNNSGGLLNSVIDISGLFLDKNSLVVTTKDKKGLRKEECKTTQNPIANKNIPIFIMVNNYTASAAEILAGALKIHSQNASKEKDPKSPATAKLQVFIVGEKTFGKGSVQEIIPISNNCAIKLTTSLYFLPNDTSIQGRGIEPDFIIEKLFPTPEKIAWFLNHYGHEKSLKHSINPLNLNQEKNPENKSENKPEDKKDDKNKNSKNKKAEPKSWEARIIDNLTKDNQFIETIGLINIFNLSREYFPEKTTDRETSIKYLKGVVAIGSKINMEEIKTDK